MAFISCLLKTSLDIKHFGHSVWPDFAKRRNFGKMLSLVLWQVCDITGLINIVANGQILKNYQTIWSHWHQWTNSMGRSTNLSGKNLSRSRTNLLQERKFASNLASYTVVGKTFLNKVVTLSLPLFTVVVPWSTLVLRCGTRAEAFVCIGDPVTATTMEVGILRYFVFFLPTASCGQKHFLVTCTIRPLNYSSETNIGAWTTFNWQNVDVKQQDRIRRIRMKLHSTQS